MKHALERFFQMKENGSSLHTEIVAGLTTFLTMAYIIVVNPLILSDAGIDKGSIFIATILISAFSTLLMGLYARWPVALAPGMGLNAFFTYYVVLTLGIAWQQALFAVFCSGILFLIVSVTPIRRRIIKAIPHNLKIGIGVGVGLFLLFIGLQNAGFVVANQATITGIGDLKNPTVLMSALGFLLILVLEARKIRGSLIITMLLITIVSFFTTDNEFGGIVGRIPEFKTLGALDFNMASLINVSFLIVVFSLLFVDFFDSTGTLLAIHKSLHHHKSQEGEEKEEELSRRPLIVDSIATIVGSILGTSTATAYIESATGIRQGGRTGLTAVVTGLLFIACLFFFPLINSIPSYATAPALIYVGFLFIQNLRDLDLSNIFELIPAMVAAILMPFTFSITHGIIFGFLTHLIIIIAEGKIKSMSPIVWIVSALGIVYLVL